MKKSWLHQFRESDQWARFKANRLGYWSLWIFTGLFVLSLFAELIANDRPILVSYQGSLYAPIVKDYPETTFGGDFPTPTDYLDPDIKKTFSQKGNWAIYPLITYRYDTLNYFAKEPNPASPSLDNLLGTDDRGRDVVARLIYGFSLSVLFGLCLTIIGVAIGVLTGAVMGYFGGKVDLISQRIIEVWSSMPELYLLIIFASIFAPSVGLLIILLSLFGWMGLSDYVRAEFLKNRSLEYVRAAQALGLSSQQIMWRHILPNSIGPIVVYTTLTIPSVMLFEAVLSFLGMGVKPPNSSWGVLIEEGASRMFSNPMQLVFPSVFFSLTLLSLNFLGDGLRDALDPKSSKD